MGLHEEKGRIQALSAKLVEGKESARRGIDRTETVARTLTTQEQKEVHCVKAAASVVEHLQEAQKSLSSLLEGLVDVMALNHTVKKTAKEGAQDFRTTGHALQLTQETVDAIPGAADVLGYTEAATKLSTLSQLRLDNDNNLAARKDDRWWVVAHIAGKTLEPQITEALSVSNELSEKVAEAKSDPYPVSSLGHQAEDGTRLLERLSATIEAVDRLAADW